MFANSGTPKSSVSIARFARAAAVVEDEGQHACFQVRLLQPERCAVLQHARVHLRLGLHLQLGVDQHLEVAAFDIAGQSYQVRDHRARALRAPRAGDRDLLVDPLQRVPVDPSGEVGEEKGDRIARPGAMKAAIVASSWPAGACSGLGRVSGSRRAWGS